MSAELTWKDIRVLRAAAHGRSETFLPWRGMFGRAKALCRAGLLKEAGASVMPPYVLYVITDAGRRALLSQEKANG